MKQHIVRIAIGLAIMLFFAGHAARFYNVGLITQLDNIIYDARMRLTMPRTVDPRIVILDIDEKSLQQVGRWPWPRDVMARLIDKLFDKYGVALVGFDVVFAEADYSSGIRALDEMAQNQLKQDPGFQDLYARMRPGLDNDGLFARAIKGRPVVLGYYFSSEKDSPRTGAIPAPVLPKGTFTGRNIAFTSWIGYGGNLPQFQNNAAAAGHFNPVVDFDGVVRRVPMLAELDGAYYESLSLAMLRTLIALKNGGKFPKVEPGFAPHSMLNKGYAGLEWLKVGPVRIPVDDTASALIPFRGGKFSFPYVSLADVLFDRVKPDALSGRIALVGTTAPGLLDLRSTPVDSVYPGVEIHANLISGMIDREIKQKPPYMLGAEVVLLVLGGAALAVLIPMLSALWATAATLLAAALISSLDVAIWMQANMVLPLASALLMTVALYTMNMAYGYFVESRSKRQFTELFGQYVPPELVDKMAEDPQKYNMEGKEEVLTVLFSDVRGFTTISESLSAKELSGYINDYLTSMSLVIRGNRGTLDKYIGDAIMAFWGAPVEDPAHARNGVLTALQMQRRAVTLNEEFRAKGWPEFHIGIGVNSGRMRVGDMGSKLRKAYTVMGDPVNLGSRLEGITKQYGVGILVGEDTRKAVKDVVFREIDRVRVKGKDEAVAIFEPLGLEGEVEKSVHDELRLWNQCLRHYRSRDWDQAEVALLNLQRMRPDCQLYRAYVERIEHYRREPPEAGWDGVTKFATK
ncbi:MAG: adenylate/guanylate cyclase domain-containing protein [Burkholderiales bacterium]